MTAQVPQTPTAGPVRDGCATPRCGLCGQPLTGRGDQLWCSVTCRQRAWRRARSVPAALTAAPPATAPAVVYECPECQARYLEQRCPDCNTWCRRLGAGGPCPHCDELVVVSDILPAAQMPGPPRRPAASG